MRILIVDKTLRSARKLATEIGQVHPGADILVYNEPQPALASIAEHHPDVVLVAAALGPVDGPEFVQQARGLADAGRAKFVGVVDDPSPQWSTRFVDAGASVVARRPLDSFAARMALRHAAGGVPG